MSSEADEEGLDLFQEPTDFYEPEKQATFASHQLLSGKELTVRLVGHNPLWGHFLWNAGRTISEYLEENAKELVENRTVLELGAGAGLPSLVCALNGAAQTVVTDYPDAELVENLQYNVDHCELLPKPPKITAEGYLWGAPTRDLTKYLADGSGFDVLILADLLFNHSEHAKLIKTVQLTLKKSPNSRAYVFFTPYRPWLYEKDLAFFDLAKEAGFTVAKTFEKVMDKVMFEEDPGVSLSDRFI
ncbi:uncharacterized protein J4E92_001410 [Alternaria infectoria]|uniref:uncharacterized protein n=1 Tax=Alternaria infectoria TaxID=45303 RepID=UPI00221FC1F1|nr:uncharacterized protein J4E92_001410 [Alternaria infectoria]KAI4940122.1 hypothetical protein J4E92_001410 [Alternaria infectoria]